MSLISPVIHCAEPSPGPFGQYTMRRNEQYSYGFPVAP